MPTPDHFIPLLHIAGIATIDSSVQPSIQGYSLGSLSMTSYNIGTRLHLPREAEWLADLPQGVSPDETNA